MEKRGNINLPLTVQAGRFYLIPVSISISNKVVSPLVIATAAGRLLDPGPKSPFSSLIMYRPSGSSVLYDPSSAGEICLIHVLPFELHTETGYSR
jgi:hypothetical protein